MGKVRWKKGGIFSEIGKDVRDIRKDTCWKKENEKQSEYHVKQGKGRRKEDGVEGRENDKEKNRWREKR